MSSPGNVFARILCALVLLALIVVAASAQQGRNTARGNVVDEVGAVIVGATVTLTDASGKSKTATTNSDGVYVFSGLPAGKYTVHAVAAGFAPSDDAEVNVSPTNREPIKIAMKIAAIESQVKVSADSAISVDPANNGNQTVISGKDLDALPDDPDEMAAALQALAGPSVGPNGGQIFIDGFSSGNMPPKESIREIRIQQNPFAPENDQPSGRIDILTKPGTDKFRGTATFNFTDESLNARNPFSTQPKRTPFQVRQFGGNFSGPIKAKKASFFLEVNKNDLDDNELIAATILDPSFNRFTFGEGVIVPRRTTSFSPRVDYAINSNNTLVARYSYNHNEYQNLGVSGFSLPERAFNTSSTSQVIQATETAVLNATTVNETRFQFNHSRNENVGINNTPTISVSGSFTGGGSGVGDATNTTNRLELQNFTAIQHGNHALKFGARLRDVNIDDISPSNFNGTWGFTGNPFTGVTSIQRYQQTLLLLQQTGTIPSNAPGVGPSQFIINTGNPEATVSQFDVGIYGQDDWKIRSNLLFSYGLRYEYQTNAHSKFDFAPRIGFAWSPGSSSATHPPKTVIRGGAGVFYNRFSESQTLTANRFNGSNELEFLFTESTNPANPTAAGTLAVLNSFRCVGAVAPDCVVNLPSAALLAAHSQATQQIIWRVDPDLQIPTDYLGGIQIEHQFPKNVTVTVGTYEIRILHMLRARDINAPLPASSFLTRPNPTAGQIYEYEASGHLNQAQFFVSFRGQINPSLSVNGSYAWSKSLSNTDGPGSFPMNSYDLSGEYGRSSFDIRNRFSFFGTYTSKLWKLVFNPFIIASSGPPFNIVTGLDANLDGIANERPSFAGANANCNDPNIRCTAFGNFNLKPLPGDPIIPRNYGQGPGSLTVNLRISRTFGFVNAHNAAAASGQSRPSEGGPGPGSRGPSIPGGGGGGGRGPGGGGGGFPGLGGPGSSEKKYNITLSLFFVNILNDVNPTPPVGNLQSPLFGQSLGLAGGAGGFLGGGGGGGGAAGSPNAGNRRIYASVRFNF
jgi:hypothetical protein